MTAELEVAEMNGTVRYDQAVNPRERMSPAKEVVATPETERVPVVREFVLIEPAVTLVVEALAATKLVVERLVVVAEEAVALTKVMFWKVELAKERMPPVAVVKPVTERVPARVELPATERVPVAIKFVERKSPALVVEATVRVPRVAAPVTPKVPERVVLPATERVEPRVTAPLIVAVEEA